MADAPEKQAEKPADKPKEIRKSILIIKSQPKSLSAVESFLKNRDWKIQSTTNMKEALTYMVSQKPSFVMISVDHPNKKVRGLPKLLSQAFPVFVMVFAESNSTSSYKNLVDSGCAYRINAPATGPAVERTINKIIRDQESEKENRSAAGRAQQMTDEKDGGNQIYVAKADKSNGPSSGMISIQGGQQGGEGGGFAPNGSADFLRGLSDSGEDDDTDIASFLSSAAAEAKNNPSNFATSDAARNGDSEMGSILTAESLAEEANLEDARQRKKRKGSGSGQWVPVEGEDENSADGEADGAGFLSGNSSGVDGSSDGGQLGGAIVQKGAGRGPGGTAGEGLGAGDLMSSDEEGANGGSLSGSAGGKAGGRIQPKRQHNSAGIDAPEGSDDSDASRAGGSLGRSSNGSGASDGTDHVMPGHASKKNPHAAPQVRYDESDFEGGPLESKSDSSEPPVFGKSAKKGAIIGNATDDDRAGSGGSGSLDAKKSKENEIQRVRGATGWQKDDNIIVRGTQKALDDSLNIGDGVVREKVEDSSNVACLIVESAKFSGFLVAALGKNRKIDKKFIDVIRDRLGKFLKDNGEPIKDEESMGLKIKKVDFEDWALEYADFLRKSVHDGEEIAMAFFPFADAKTQVAESASAEMGAVKLDELKGDLAVDFNLYVYLPSNKKYVLYTPRGSKFYGNQKERLDRMGVTHMHVRRTELQDVSKYRAQNYLNAKIEEFQAKKKTPGAGPAPAAA